MEKILTIAIAAYNMEKYLEKAINSCLVESIVDDIQILIVNDGSTDETVQIANKYAQMYPKSIFVISKQNGGYGSAVNAGIAKAFGKYFKLLDADDWYIKDNLPVFVEKLKEADSDIIFTPYIECFSKENKQIEKRPGMLPLEKEVSTEKVIRWPQLSMHGITVKTCLLKQNKVVLAERCFYTDAQFYMMVFKYAETFLELPIPIYCYRLEREGQSVSLEGLKKHIDEHIYVLKSIVEFYYNDEFSDYHNKNEVIRSRISALYFTSINVLWNIDSCKMAKKKMIDLDHFLLKYYPEGVPYLGRKLYILRKTNYVLFYWIWLNMRKNR